MTTKGSSSQDMAEVKGNLPTPHEDILTELRDKLIKGLKPEEIKGGLLQNGVLSYDDLDELQELPRKKGVEFILTQVRHSGSTGLGKFLVVLRQAGYGSLADDIERVRSRKFPEQINIVLFGKTGVGKSYLGNSLLNQEAFKSKYSFESVTTDCSLRSTTKSLCQKAVRVNIIDTPGLADTKTSTNEIMKEIFQCMQLAQGKVDIFIIVFKLGRATEEEKQSFQIFNDRFGCNSERFVLIVFTHKDSIPKDKQLSAMIDESPFLQETVRRFKNRYCAVGIDSIDEDVKEIFKQIENIMVDNNYSHYTSDFFQSAEQDYTNKMEEEKRRLQEEKDKEVGELVEKRLVDMEKRLREEITKELEDKKMKESKKSKENNEARDESPEEEFTSPGKSKEQKDLGNIDEETLKIISQIEKYLKISENSTNKINKIQKLISRSYLNEIPSSSSSSFLQPHPISNIIIHSLKQIIEDTQDPNTAIGILQNKIEEWTNLIQENETPVKSDNDNLDSTSSSPQETEVQNPDLKLDDQQDKERSKQSSGSRTDTSHLNTKGGASNYLERGSGEVSNLNAKGGASNYLERGSGEVSNLNMEGGDNSHVNRLSKFPTYPQCPRVDWEGVSGNAVDKLIKRVEEWEGKLVDWQDEDYSKWSHKMNDWFDDRQYNNKEEFQLEVRDWEMYIERMIESGIGDVDRCKSLYELFSKLSELNLPDDVIKRVTSGCITSLCRNRTDLKKEIVGFKGKVESQKTSDRNKLSILQTLLNKVLNQIKYKQEEIGQIGLFYRGYIDCDKILYNVEDKWNLLDQKT